MVVSVSGAFYVFETETDPTREDLTEFFKDLTEDDILEVRVKKPFGRDIVYHVTRFFLDNNLQFMNLALEKSDQVFQQVSRMNLHDCILPVFEDGRCVNFVKNIRTNYEHYYRYEGEIDVSFLNRYKKIALTGLNEYSVELYKKALPLWKGEEVFVVGPEWRDYMDVLPELAGIQVTEADEASEIESLRDPEEMILQITEGVPQDEDLSGRDKNIMYYDEVMALTFMFSYVISPGCLNPDKKFFVIDGVFGEEEIFDIQGKVFTAARYAQAKGYLPIFQIVSSDMNIYSDSQGEDIWNKFFLQPGGYSMKEVHNSSYLALSPNMNLSAMVRHVMDKESDENRLSWPRGIFNSRVKKYIKEREKQVLPHPDRTLGVLALSLGWTDDPLSGRTVHAFAETLMEKLSEAEGSWDFDWVYLVSDSEELCEKMREQYGNRLIFKVFVNPERSAAEPGQFLTELHGEDTEVENGFWRGAEYLCCVSLLSQCASLIASGDCGELSETLRENEGKYEHMCVLEK